MRSNWLIDEDYVNTLQGRSVRLGYGAAGSKVMSLFDVKGVYLNRAAIAGPVITPTVSNTKGVLRVLQQGKL
jgi:hypothetical protein